MSDNEVVVERNQSRHQFFFICPNKERLILKKAHKEKVNTELEFSNE